MVRADLLEAMAEHVAAAPRFVTAHSLLVARDDELLLERYFGGYGPTSRHDLKSVTKSVVALLAGIALREGVFASLETPLSTWLPELAVGGDARKGAITLRHALTMQAGLSWDEWADGYRDPNELYRAADSVAYVCGKPMAEAPGTRFRYSTGTAHLLTAALQRASGENVAAFAAKHLLNPLGIEKFGWRRHADGIGYGGVGLALTPRSLLRIGQLCLFGGRWQGRQIVPEDWIAEIASVHAGRDWWEGPYGLLWWIRPHGFAASGYGGQLVLVMPEEGLVAVLTAKPEGPPKDHIPLAAMDELADRFLLPPLWERPAMRLPRAAETVRSGSGTAPRRTEIDRRLLDVDGLRVDSELRRPARTASDGGAWPLMVLVNTLMVGMAAWSRLATVIAERSPVFMYDRPGSGRSDPAPAGRTVAAMAEELPRVLRAGSVPTPCVLVARGVGCFVARLVAANRPELVAGLILIEPLHEDQDARLRPLLPPEAVAAMKELESKWPAPEGLSFHWLDETNAAFRSARPLVCPVLIVTGQPYGPPAIPGWPTEAANDLRRALHLELVSSLRAEHAELPGQGPRLVTGYSAELGHLILDFVGRL